MNLGATDHRPFSDTSNNRQVLDHITAAKSSGASPRTSANLSSTERTKAGSLRRFLLRLGAGVKYGASVSTGKGAQAGWGTSGSHLNYYLLCPISHFSPFPYLHDEKG